MGFEQVVGTGPETGPRPGMGGRPETGARPGMGRRTETGPRLGMEPRPGMGPGPGPGSASGAGRTGERLRRRSPGSLRTAVVAALVEQPAHGYDLTNRLNRRMGPVLQADPRRIYEVLEQLEKEGLAHSTEQHAAGAPHRPRRVFSATERGRAAYAGWLGEREPVPLARADIYAL